MGPPICLQIEPPGPARPHPKKNSKELRNTLVWLPRPLFEPWGERNGPTLVPADKAAGTCQTRKKSVATNCETHGVVVATASLLTTEESEMDPPLCLQIKPPEPARLPKRAPQGAAKQHSTMATTSFLTPEQNDMGPPLCLQTTPPEPARLPKRTPQGAAKHHGVVATAPLLSPEKSEMDPPLCLQIKPPGPARPPTRAPQGAAKHDGMVAAAPFLTPEETDLPDPQKEPPRSCETRWYGGHGPCFDP